MSVPQTGRLFRDTKLYFGKHERKRLRDLPDGYLMWLAMDAKLRSRELWEDVQAEFQYRQLQMEQEPYYEEKAMQPKTYSLSLTGEEYGLLQSALVLLSKYRILYNSMMSDDITSEQVESLQNKLVTEATDERSLGRLKEQTESLLEVATHNEGVCHWIEWPQLIRMINRAYQAQIPDDFLGKVFTDEDRITAIAKILFDKGVRSIL
jgi:hypothetical protein